MEVYNLSKLFKIKKQKIHDDPVVCKSIYNKRYRTWQRIYNPLIEDKRGRPVKYTDEERKELNRKRAREGMKKLRERKQSEKPRNENEKPRNENEKPRNEKPRNENEKL